MKKPSQVRSVHIGTRITKSQFAALKKRRGSDRTTSDYLCNLIEWDLADADIEKFTAKEGQPPRYRTSCTCQEKP